MGRGRGRMIAHDDRLLACNLIDEAIQSGARQQCACEVLGIHPRTYRRWRVADSQVCQDSRIEARQGRPSNALSEEEKQSIVEVCNQPAYSSLSPSQIVPKLADQGEYIASESSFYRVLKERQQLKHRGHTKPPQKRHKPAAYKAKGPNQVWSWDITFLATCIRGTFYKLYMLMDIFSRYIVGWEVHEAESSELASELVEKACLSEGVVQGGIVLHSDNGAPMKGSTLLATLEKLGVVPSFSRPSVSDDNPYSESLFKTVKYRPAYPEKPFESIEQAREWVLDFVNWYNHRHCHSGIRFVTPAQKHVGDDHTILAKRHEVYLKAKAQNPARWSGHTRDWSVVEAVNLNPDKEGFKSTVEEEVA